MAEEEQLVSSRGRPAVRCDWPGCGKIIAKTYLQKHKRDTHEQYGGVTGKRRSRKSPMSTAAAKKRDVPIPVPVPTPAPVEPTPTKSLAPVFAPLDSPDELTLSEAPGWSVWVADNGKFYLVKEVGI